MIHSHKLGITLAEQMHDFADGTQRRLSGLEPAIEAQAFASQVHKLPGMHEQHDG